MEMEHINWLEFAQKMAEAARAKLAEDREKLEKVLSQNASASSHTTAKRY
jgi:hypothetical protein